jgi:hypothetical protein
MAGFWFVSTRTIASVTFTTLMWGKKTMWAVIFSALVSGSINNFPGVGPEWKRDLRYLPNTLITLDSDGKEHHRTVGFLSPEELIPSLMLGMAKCHFDAARFDQTGLILEKLLAEYSRSDSAAEATYLRGGGRFKSTHDLKHLREAYERLQANYPSSEWTKKAYP